MDPLDPFHPLLLFGALLLLTQHEIGPLLTHRPLFLFSLWSLFRGGSLPLLLHLALTLEYLWLDRIPAGGLRVPSVCTAALASLIVMEELRGHGSLLSESSLFVYLLFFSILSLLLFVPLDGGLRRLGNLVSDRLVHRFTEEELSFFPYMAGAFLVRVSANYSFLFALASLNTFFLGDTRILRFFGIFEDFPYPLLSLGVLLCFLLRQLPLFREWLRGRG